MTFRRARQGVLLLVLIVVAIWGWLNHRADTFTFAWDRPLEVAVVPLIDSATDITQGSPAYYFLHRFLSRAGVPGDNLAGVEKWFSREFERWTSRQENIIGINVIETVKVDKAPPELPDGTGGFFERWNQTNEFLGYFTDLDEKHDLVKDAYDVTMFVYFYDPDRGERFKGYHPVAARREKFGVVLVPLNTENLGFYVSALAHEMCHTFAATDKYDGDQCMFPDGYAEPERKPLHPQEYAEIMAMGIPIAPGKDVGIGTIGQCRVGEKTAEEMGWK